MKPSERNSLDFPPTNTAISIACILSFSLLTKLRAACLTKASFSLCAWVLSDLFQDTLHEMLSFSRIVNVSFVLPFHAYIHASLLKFLYLNKAKTSLILGHSLETTSISPLPFTPKVSQERSGQPCHVLIFLLCFPFFFYFCFLFFYFFFLS